MKEFEKWFNGKRSPEEILKVQARITPGNLTDIIAETAWRAALRWVLITLGPDLEDWEQDFLDGIKQELGDA